MFNLQASKILTFTCGFFLVLGLLIASAQAQTTVADLATSLAAATTTDEVGQLVTSATVAGLTEEQIANAFGRASVTTANPDMLSQAYSSFVASCAVSVETLDSAYSVGQSSGCAVSTETLDSAYSAGQSSAGGGSGGGGSGGGDNGSFSPPSGGSGGGGGSSNE